MSAAEHEAAIARLLADLGDTADAVADQLRAKGIKGEPRKCAACPVQNYLRPLTTAPNLSTTGVSVWFDDPDGDVPIEVMLPRPVSQFISLFDLGVYLDLIQTEGAA